VASRSVTGGSGRPDDEPDGLVTVCMMSIPGRYSKKHVRTCRFCGGVFMACHPTAETCDTDTCHAMRRVEERKRKLAARRTAAFLSFIDQLRGKYLTADEALSGPRYKED